MFVKTLITNRTTKGTASSDQLVEPGAARPRRDASATTSESDDQAPRPFGDLVEQGNRDNNTTSSSGSASPSR